MRPLLALVLMLAVSAEAGWYKGNTHTHTSESDGDSSPADVVRWYCQHGYDFLVITDHERVTVVENDGGILLIHGEEVTDWLPKKPLHVNAIGIETAVTRQRGATAVEVLQRNVNAVRELGGLAAVNHPNFGWAFGSRELLEVEGVTLLEIASGHPYVNMQGPPSVEQMWDDLLTAGRTIWGIAADDSHHLKRPWDRDVALPGKAWIVVRAESRDAASILNAMRRGDFYASTGVELTDFSVANGIMTVSIRARNLAHYRTQFIGSGGRLLAETDANPATFTLGKDERYVRAKVIDSNGRIAWLQPHFR